MARISAAEIQKHFGAYSELAQREPVIITNHGRDSLVLLSARDYARLKAMDNQRAYTLDEAPQEFLDALAAAEPPAWTDKYNHELEDK